jgi:hypothetical protein
VVSIAKFATLGVFINLHGQLFLLRYQKGGPSKVQKHISVP